jgi:hypothetical protein
VTLLVIVLGCSGRPSPIDPCPNPAAALIPEVDTLAVGATRLFSIGTTRPNIKWSTSNTDVASIDQGGLATAVAVGTAQVLAIDEASPANCPEQWYATVVVR